MAQTDTYSNLVSLIEALMGASFGTTESTRLRHLINRRAWAAYRETDYWENFLVIGEERAVNVNTNVVPYTGAVFDATEGLTDINPYTATVDTFMRIHNKNPWLDKSVTEFEFQGGSSGARLQGYNASYGLSKTVDSATAAAGTVTIQLGAAVYVDYFVDSTIRLEGFDTSPADINGTHTITAVSAASYQAGRTQVQFTKTGAAGSWSMAGDETAKAPIVYATYKKRLTDTYGDGTGGTTSTVPQEFFEYIAHGAYADMLRADSQYEAAMLEERAAEQALQRELERLDRQHTIQTIGNRIATHGTEQGRQSTYR